MKLFECARDSEGWRGALIIVAENKDRAETIFREKDGWGYSYKPFSITELDITKEGVVYDDTSR